MHHHAGRSGRRALRAAPQRRACRNMTRLTRWRLGYAGWDHKPLTAMVHIVESSRSLLAARGHVKVRTPSGETSLSSCRSRQELGQAHQIERRTREHGEPIDIGEAPQLEFANPRHRLQPTERRLHARARVLAHRLPVVPHGAAVNRTAARPREALSDVRSSPTRAPALQTQSCQSPRPCWASRDSALFDRRHKRASGSVVDACVVVVPRGGRGYRRRSSALPLKTPSVRPKSTRIGTRPSSHGIARAHRKSQGSFLI
jgi:hypothetical protein